MSSLEQAGDSSIDEIQRMHYLAALDLDCYMPRRILVHAPAPNLCRLPLPPELRSEPVLGIEGVGAGTPISAVSHTAAPHAAVSQANAPISASAMAAITGSELPATSQLGNKAPSNAASELLASLSRGKQAGGKQSGGTLDEGKPAEGKTPKVNKSSPVSVAGAVVDKTAIANTVNDDADVHVKIKPFSLSIWRAGSVMIVDSRCQDVFLPTDRLFYNLMGALGFTRAEISVAEILNWPLVPVQARPVKSKNTNVKAEDILDVSARTDIQAFFDGKMCQGGVSNMLLLGEPASQYLLPSDTSYEKCLYKQVLLPEFSMPAVILPSLSDILLQPILKKSVWGRLREFKKL